MTTLGVQPRVGCGVALIDAAGRLLIVRRLRAPEAGHWALPGGKLDPFERIETAMKREVLEELGVDIALGPDLCVVETCYPALEQHWVAPVRRGRIVRGAPRILEPDALAAWRWLDQGERPEPIGPMLTQVLDALDAGR